MGHYFMDTQYIRRTKTFREIFDPVFRRNQVPNLWKTRMCMCVNAKVPKWSCKADYIFTKTNRKKVKSESNDIFCLFLLDRRRPPFSRKSAKPFIRPLLGILSTKPLFLVGLPLEKPSLAATAVLSVNMLVSLLRESLSLSLITVTGLTPTPLPSLL